MRHDVNKQVTDSRVTLFELYDRNILKMTVNVRLHQNITSSREREREESPVTSDSN